jgi:hypothetical protein
MADTFKIVVGKPTIDKDPNAVLDYSVDWTDWLATTSPVDTITTHNILLPVGSGLTTVTSSVTGGVVTFWVSGGTVGTTEKVTVRITTAGGRVDDRTVYLKIKDR